MTKARARWIGNGRDGSHDRGMALQSSGLGRPAAPSVSGASRATRRGALKRAALQVRRGHHPIRLRGTPRAPPELHASRGGASMARPKGASQPSVGRSGAAFSVTPAARLQASAVMMTLACVTAVVTRFLSKSGGVNGMSRPSCRAGCSRGVGSSSEGRLTISGDVSSTPAAGSASALAVVARLRLLRREAGR